MNSFVTAFVVFVVACYSVHAADLSGFCNEDETCSWVFDPNTEVLTISGTGYMVNYTSATDVPWLNDEFKEQIVNAVVEDGVKSLGNYAFVDLVNLASVTVNGNMDFVADHLCQGSGNLTDITFQGDINEVAANAFIECAGALTIKGSVETTSPGSSPENVGSFGLTSFSSIIIEGSIDQIARYSFYGSTSLVSVSVGSVGSVAQYAFYDYDNKGYNYDLERVTIGGLDGTVGAQAFYSLPNLTNVKLTGTNVQTDSRTFANCEKLQNVEIESDTVALGERCFNGCNGLTSVTIKGNASWIGEDAFKDCTGSVTITGYLDSFAFSTGLARGSSAITSISIGSLGILTTHSLCRGCSSVENVTIGELRNNYGSYLFNGMESLSSVEIGSAAFLGSDLFTYLDALTTVVIGSLPALSQNQFRELTSLVSVTIGGFNGAIGNNAFYKCINLENLDISGNITSIGNAAFSGCEKLTRMVIPATCESIGMSAFSIYEDNTDICYLESLTFEGGVGTIGGNAFRACIALTEVVIPGSVGRIEQFAFAGCEGINRFVVEGNLSYVGSQAFYGCYGDLLIKGSLLSFGDYSLQNAFTSVTIEGNATLYNSQDFSTVPSPTKTIIIGALTRSTGSYTFSEMTNLSTIVIGSVPSIGFQTFRNLYKLVNATINIDNGGLGDGAFSGCSYLKDLVLSGTITYIGTQAFYGCGNLTSFVVPNTVETIGSQAFSKSGIKEIVIPGSVKSIGSNTFTYCDDECTCPLVSLVLQKGVEIIGDEAFYYCSNLETVDLPESVQSIGESAFYSCEGLKKIIIPFNVSYIGQDAFENCKKLDLVYYKGNRNPCSDSTTAFDQCNNFERVIVPQSYKDKRLCGRRVKKVSNTLSGADGVNSFLVRVLVSVTVVVCVILGQW